MSMPGINVSNILNEHEELGLKMLAGEKGLTNRINMSEINRPGLSLTGFYESFAHDRIQIFGKGEWAYITSRTPEDLKKIAAEFLVFISTASSSRTETCPLRFLWRIANNSESLL